MNQEQIKLVVEKINKGQVGVIPTDTVYGIVSSVFNESSIERIYAECLRPKDKPFIILISCQSQLKNLEVKLNSKQIELVNMLWPGPISIILPNNTDKFSYLHRGMNSLAIRLPDLQFLQKIIDQTGPIVATSANLSGLPTPQNIEDIKKQLPTLDFYVSGKVGTTPSRLVRLSSEGTLEWLDR